MLMGSVTSETLFALIGALPENTIWEAFVPCWISTLGIPVTSPAINLENYIKLVVAYWLLFPNEKINLIE
jgi:uncharacterized membrane protein